MKHLKIKPVITAVALLLSSNVSAIPVTTWTVDINSIFDVTSVLPNPGVTIVNDKKLTWGTGGVSGLEITDSPSVEQVDTDGAAVANISITHTNQPIGGDTLTNVDIISALTLTPFTPVAPGLPTVPVTFDISFKETPNGANPCANGGANGSGVNAAGCADIFVMGDNALNFMFTYPDPDGEVLDRQYFISFFELTSGLNPLSDEACAAAGAAAGCLGFETPENENTTVQFASLITTSPVNVPEPGILALLGLSALGLSFRRKSA